MSKFPAVFYSVCSTLSFLSTLYCNAMEAVGAIASLVQIVDAALSVAKTSRELYRSYREAPMSTKGVENQITLLQSVVDDYLRLRPCLEFNGSNSNSLPSFTSQTVATALLQVSGALQQLKIALNDGGDGHTKTASRIRWAFAEKKAVREAQEQLEIAKSTLTNVLLLFNLHFSALHQCTLQELTAAYRALEQQLSESNTNQFPSLPEEQCCIALGRGSTKSATSATERQSCFPTDLSQKSSSTDLLDIKPCVTLDSAEKGQRTSRVKTLRLLAPDRRVFGSISSASDCYKVMYSLSIRARLPWWLGYQAFILEMKVWYFVSSWLNLTMLPGYIGFNGYVSNESLIAQACFRGDENMVRKLISEGKANPNDFILDGDLIPALLQGYLTVGRREMTVLAVCMDSRSSDPKT